MIGEIVSFLIMLNPFALFIYLGPVMKELKSSKFRKVLFKASIISFVIFVFFVATGNFIFTSVFRIDFESFRIFGGLIIFSFAYFYIIKGHKAMIHTKGSIDDLASEIALPFMVGSGTISLSILMGNSLSLIEGIIALSIILGVNFALILVLKRIREDIPKKKYRIAFDKNMGILLRMTGFFVGAIGVNMVLTGIKNLFL